MKSLKNGSGIVYSTEFGTMCPGCNRTKVKCNCLSKKPIHASDGVVWLKRETKGRKGKGVTLITGIPQNTSELKKLAKSLKQKCGCGGSIKNGIIEIQGDQRNKLEQELRGIGYIVKRSGG